MALAMCMQVIGQTGSSVKFKQALGSCIQTHRPKSAHLRCQHFKSKPTR